MDHSKNETIIESLYDAYADAIFRFVLLRVRSREQAQDIVQEVFMRMWNTYISQGLEIEEPRGLLYTIARNLVINTYARGKVHDSLDTLMEGGLEFADPNADSSAEALASDVHTLLDSLTPIEKELVTLRHLEGLSVKEIAVMFDLSENATSVRIYRALERLQKKCVDEDMEFTKQNHEK
jgi:RNA polymerase sigma-70 factor (ECF subfamily)